MGNRFVSFISKDTANVCAGVWRLCKGNSRNLFLKTIGREFVFGTEENILVYGGKSDRNEENCLMRIAVIFTFQ
jgi:hypothetical protein